jgi:hypothetical protein
LQYVIANWPANFDARSTFAEPYWLCATCVPTLGAGLIGTEVSVWWHDDAEGYSGVVNAFDHVSGCHRVLYEDDEWEFLNLAVEPVLYAL